jgi:hypothetical protein
MQSVTAAARLIRVQRVRVRSRNLPRQPGNCLCFIADLTQETYFTAPTRFGNCYRDGLLVNVQTNKGAMFSHGPSLMHEVRCRLDRRRNPRYCISR